MSSKDCALIFLGIAVVAVVVLPVPTRGQCRPIAASHASVLSSTFGKAKVVAKLSTVALQGPCADACPDYRGLASRRLALAQDLSITVSGRSVYVSLLAYITLTDPHLTSLREDRKGYVLKIDGDVGTDSSGYFVLIHFNSKGVDEVKFYSNLDPDHPLSVTHFYDVVLN